MYLQICISLQIKLVSRIFDGLSVEEMITSNTLEELSLYISNLHKSELVKYS